MNITAEDWSRVYRTMVRYNRAEGYVDFVGERLTFFDSDPCLGGVHACHVTAAEVARYMSDASERTPSRPI